MATATEQPTEAPAERPTERPMKKPTKKSTTVRISEESYQLLREMAAQECDSMQNVLDRALERYRRQRFWEEMNVAYAAIQSDPEAVAAEKKEFALWDVTLMDGLDPNEVWADGGAAQATGEKVA